MFFEIITVTSIILLSSAENLIQPQQSPQYAISSQSFHRDDVPLSYKYSAVHVYTTTKPAHLPHIEPKEDYQIPDYHKIQYAPLNIVKTAAAYHHYGKDQQTNNYQPNSEINKKLQLEPKLNSDETVDKRFNIINDDNNKQFISGHNIEVIEAVDRSPGHNAVYRSYPQSAPQNKINYLKRYQLKLNTQPEHTSTENATNVAVSSSKTGNPLFKAYALIARQNIRPHLLGNGEIPKIEDEDLWHPKSHRLHLNIARLNGIVQALPVAPSNNIGLPSNHNKKQTFVFLPNIADIQHSIQKTLMYPVQKNNTNNFVYKFQ